MIEYVIDISNSIHGETIFKQGLHCTEKDLTVWVGDTLVYHYGTFELCFGEYTYESAHKTISLNSSDFYSNHTDCGYGFYRKHTDYGFTQSFDAEEYFKGEA